MLNLEFDDTDDAEETSLPVPVEKERYLGIYDDMPDTEYRSAPGANKSGLDLINKSPSHYITEKRNPRPPTPAMFVGRAMHSLILEPEKFDGQYVCAPKDAPKRPTKAQLNAKKPGIESQRAMAYWKEFNEVNADKVIIDNVKTNDTIWGVSDWDMIHYARDSVVNDPIASVLVAGIAERSIWWVDDNTKKLCKCRLDSYNEAHNMVVDLKSTIDASYSGFARSIDKYRYFVQHAFYSDGSKSAGLNLNKTEPFVFVCVEKEPPYAVACYGLDREWIHVGRTMYEHDLDIYKQCHESGEWPGYPIGIRDQVMPGYAKFHPIS